jgi:hypothetical protein
MLIKMNGFSARIVITVENQAAIRIVPPNGPLIFYIEITRDERLSVQMRRALLLISNTDWGQRYEACKEA